MIQITLNDKGDAVRVFKETGRLITSPLGAVVISLAGALAMWYGFAEPRGGAPKVAGRANPVAAKSGGTGKKSNTSAGVATQPSPRIRPRNTSERTDALVEHIEAENEPMDDAATSSASTGRARRSQAGAAESDTALTVDVIGPLDPRAGALAEYPAKKAAITDSAAAQKELAIWCDQRGLWEGAKTHWEAVVRLDPKNEEARKRLGFRRRDQTWVLDAASAANIADKKAKAYWSKALAAYHAQMKCKSKSPAPGRAAAVAHVEAVGDPRAAAAIWDNFAKDISHHGLMVGILASLKTPETSRMLAALAVYSPDEKAQAAAVMALRGRRAADYGEKLVSLMHAPMRFTERAIPNPGGDLVRELFVEGEAQNYQYLFSRATAPTGDSLDGCFQPRLSASEIGMARRFNENQAAMANQSLTEQIGLAKAMIERWNDSINALNERVVRVLNEACRARIRPDPEDGRRWLASTLGTQYQPAADRPKPTFTDFVAPLYNPTFLPIPVAT
jgi:hypothetical protein